MPSILCSDSRHALRSAQPGWNNGPLATGPAGLTGLLCPACGAGREADATPDLTNSRNILSFVPGGTYRAILVTTYPSGEVIGIVQRQTTLAAAVTAAAITAAERAAIETGTGGTVGNTLMARLRDFAIANGTLI